LRDTTFLAVPEADSGPRAPDPAWHDLREASDRRAAEKHALAGEVIEGRLPLRRAAAQFRDLNARPPAFNWEAFRQTYPGSSDDERHCCEVIQFVGQEVRRRPGADPAAVGRLEAELRGLLQHGDFRLSGLQPLRRPAVADEADDRGGSVRSAARSPTGRAVGPSATR
jgi:hypothetical protein